MNRSLHWLGAAALVATAPLAVAVEHAAAAMPSFSSVDKDADGYITVQEASTVPAIPETMFSSADKNGDRRLSSDEYTDAGGSDEETEEEG